MKTLKLIIITSLFILPLSACSYLPWYSDEEVEPEEAVEETAEIADIEESEDLLDLNMENALLELDLVE